MSGQYTLKSAVMDGPSDCYRLELRRIWDRNLPMLVACMLNPSTADHKRDDPTILTLMHFARLWGYGGVLVVNLFALRSPTPAALIANEARFGPKNGAYLESAMTYAAANGGMLLAAWGAGGTLDDRDQWFCSRAYHAHRLKLVCLGMTRGGHPKHPMARGKHRIPRDQRPLVHRDAPRSAA